MDCWLFELSGRDVPSVKVMVSAHVAWRSIEAGSDSDGGDASSTEAEGPVTSRLVVFVGDKKRGGLRVMDPRLELDLCVAPVAPPHVHDQQQHAVPFSSSVLPQQAQSSNIVTALTVPDGDAGCVWVGWSSGHISVLNVKRAPILEVANIGGARQRTILPRYRDWSDLMYAHRGAVHGLHGTHAGRMLVSCSYDTNIILWDAQARRQLRSLSGLIRHELQSIRRKTVGDPFPTAGVHGVCKVCVELPVLTPPSSVSASYFSSNSQALVESTPRSSYDLSVALFLAFDGGLQVLLQGLEHLKLHAASAAIEDRGAEGVGVKCFWQPGVVVSAVAVTTFLGGSDGGGSVCCIGDDSGQLRFVSCAFPLDGPLTSSTDIAHRVAERVQHESHLVAGLPQKMGKVISVVGCGATMGNTVDSPNADFFYLASYANHTVAVVSCTVTAATRGSMVLSSRVISTMATTAPVIRFSPLLPALHQEPSPLQLWYGVCADGSLASCVCHKHVAPTPSAGLNVGSWTTGDMGKQKVGLQRAFQIVHDAQRAVSAADAALESALVQHGALHETHTKLESECATLRSEVASLDVERRRLGQQLSVAESSCEALRGRLHQSDEKSTRLEDQLRIAAADMSSMRQQLVAVKEDAELEGVKVRECLVQLRQQKEDAEQLDRGWRNTEASLTDASSHNALLAAKVCDLERALAEAEQQLQQQKLASANYAALVEDQHAVIKELKHRHHEALQRIDTLADENSRLSADFSAAQRKITASKHALDEFVHSWADQPHITSSDRSGQLTKPVCVLSLAGPRAAPTSEYASGQSAEYRIADFVPPVRPFSDVAPSRHTAHEPTDLALWPGNSSDVSDPQLQRRPLASASIDVTPSAETGVRSVTVSLV